MTTNYTLDHKPIKGALATRRYFAKFERITSHMQKVTRLSQDEGMLTKDEGRILRDYLKRLANTFTALSFKHLFAGRISNVDTTEIVMDKMDSGFPVFQELMQMAADGMQAERHLKSLPRQDALKKQMVTHILNTRETPIKLQYALAQRIYYEHLQDGQIFWSQNDPEITWAGDLGNDRRHYVVHWAHYDSQTNLPAVYIMELDDTGRKALPRDERRWPSVERHLIAQSVSALSPLTIAKGFDDDFDDLHPIRLRRFIIGPMYSHHFTEQHGPLRDVLAQAEGEPGLDWALSWRVEELRSKGTKDEKTGFFSSAERQIYDIDPNAMGVQGVSDLRQSLILPHRAYQVLEELDPPSLRDVRKYVVGKNDKILSYR